MRYTLIFLVLAACNSAPPSMPDAPSADGGPCHAGGKTSVCTDVLGPKFTELVCPVYPLMNRCNLIPGHDVVCCGPWDGKD